jgi:hypothetical protein
MTDVLENLILNPVEFVPDLPEIDLNDLGLTIAAEPGPDYGESSVAVERVRQAISEGITDSHWPPVDCTIPIIARGSKTLAIADPLHRLEGWVADVQRRRTGWIRRDFSTQGGFAGSVGCPVDSASLTPAQGWTFAHNQFDNGIVLKFTRYPIWFATVEVESAEFKGSAVRDLELELAELLGTAPGLIRVLVKNEGTEDWRACLLSLECDGYSSAVTAKPKYEARLLTLAGGSTSTEVGGAKVVKCPPLTSGWQTVLSSEISGVGHMTHVGPRRMAFRVNDVSTLLGDVQWKLEWRQLGAANWIQTQEGSTPIIVSSPVVGGYQVIDLGECRPERAMTGEQRWESRLQARSLSGSGKQPLIRDVYPASTEQWMRVADASETPIDGEPTKAPGTVADETGVGTVAWTISEGGGTAILGTTVLSHYLKATNFGFAIPSATILGIGLTLHLEGSSPLILDNRIRIVKGGAIKETVDHARSGPWELMREYGGLGDLWGQAWTAADINSSGFGIAISAEGAGSGQTARVKLISMTVAYAESSDVNRICIASRSIEFSDNGIRRQHPTDEVWGDLVEEGFLPYAPAPGQTGQPMRALIVPSVGDFAARADAATVKPNAKVFYRPGYLFAREAT